MRTVLIAGAAFLAGAVLSYFLSRRTVRGLQRQVRKLRSAIKSSGNPAADELSTHEKALYYKMLDGLETGASVSPVRSPQTETMKRVVWACVLNGFAWVWCSYILAALDKPQIAEELSKVALVEIIAPVVVYAFKSVVENLSKNNHWPDKPQEEPESTTEDEEGKG